MLKRTLVAYTSAGVLPVPPNMLPSDFARELRDQGETVTAICMAISPDGSVPHPSQLPDMNVIRWEESLSHKIECSSPG